MAPPGGATRPACFGLCSENYSREELFEYSTELERCKGQLLIKEETAQVSFQVGRWQGKTGPKFVKRPGPCAFNFQLSVEHSWY
jgi:hypothetical protein